MNNLIKKPFYLVDFNSSLCNYQIFINDIPCYFHNDNTSMATHLPINQLIFKSGIQNLHIKVFPLIGEKKIQTYAFLKLKINVYDALTNNYENISTIFDYDAINLDATEKSYIEIIEKFDCKIEYESLFFLKAQKITIKKDEVVEFYQKLHNHFKNYEVDKVLNLFNNRLTEIDKSLFIEDSNNKNELEKVFNNLKNENYKIVDFPKNPIFTVYNEKIISLVDSLNNSILFFKNPLGDEFQLHLVSIQTKKGIEVFR